MLRRQDPCRAAVPRRRILRNALRSCGKAARLHIRTPFLSVDQKGGQVLYVRFDDEQHLHAWKNNHVHLGIRAAGRAEVFSDYRLRIGNEVHRDCNTDAADNTTSNVGKYRACSRERVQKCQRRLLTVLLELLVLMWQYPAPANESSEPDPCTHDAATVLDPHVWRDLVNAATYASATHVLRISAWPSVESGLAVRDAIPQVDGDDLRVIHLERDCGRFQRDEAPKDADKCQNAAALNNTDVLDQC